MCRRMPRAGCRWVANGLGLGKDVNHDSEHARCVWRMGRAVTADPPRLSFRQPMFTNVDALARRGAGTLPGIADGAGRRRHPECPSCSISWNSMDAPSSTCTWQLPYGPPTEAVVLKPAGATGTLPGNLGLHDHGGNKYFGLRKITRCQRIRIR